MNSTDPLVSVIIPCYRESGHIEACVRSILSQEAVAGGFEVLVVDGMSDDGTREIVQRLAQGHEQVRLLDNPQRFVSFALNKGIMAARGSIIIRMDAHTEYAPDYLKQCVLVLEETQADNVGGPERTKADSFIQKAVAAAYHSPFSFGGARSHDVNYEGYLDTVTYGCWRKSTLIKLGLFDEELVRNQDDELNLRLTRSGGKVWQSPRIKSWYKTRSSFREVFWQYMQYGYWKVAVIKKHWLPASWRHLVPGSCLFILLVNLILLPFVKGALLTLGVMLGLYGGAILAASIAAASRTEWSLLPILPVTFGCFHLGYGVGFLKGLVDFVILKRAPSIRYTTITR